MKWNLEGIGILISLIILLVSTTKWIGIEQQYKEGNLHSNSIQISFLFGK
ncbi:hypothetical protein Hanom_Chr05g00442281 [Helianthus anomalus]